MSAVTQVLDQIGRGDAAAAEQLLPLVYDELRRLAAAHMAREDAGHTLQPTALVHEAYVRLVGGQQPVEWRHRGHFFAAAAEAMRRILVESARRKQSRKHGGELRRQPLHADAVAALEREPDLLALDEALQRLSAQRPDLAQLVSLRYFGGLTMEQAAAALDISVRTAHRNWTYARAWLLEELRPRGSNQSEPRP